MIQSDEMMWLIADALTFVQLEPEAIHIRRSIEPRTDGEYMWHVILHFEDGKVTELTLDRHTLVSSVTKAIREKRDAGTNRI